MFSTFLNGVLAVSTCLGLLVVLSLEIRARRRPVYAKREALLTPAERAFLAALEHALGDHYRIMGKVRLADLVAPDGALGERDWKRAFYQVSSKHVDFVLCDRDTLAPVCAIELDDSSHQAPDRRERDQFVDGVFQSAGLALLHFRARRTYSRAEIRCAIRRVTRNGDAELTPSATPMPPAQRRSVSANR